MLSRSGQTTSLLLGNVRLLLLLLLLQVMELRHPCRR